MNVKEVVFKNIEKLSHKTPGLEDKLRDDLGLDSLNCMELFLNIEVDLGIAFPQEKLNASLGEMTVGETIECVEKICKA